MAPTAVVTPASATVTKEAWYEYAPSAKAAVAEGLQRIYDPEDPRWAGELMEPPYKGHPQGYLIVAEVTRVNGEIVKTKQLAGYTYHKNKAQEFMRTFIAEGGEIYQDHHYRNTMEAAEVARKEGRLADAAALKEALLEATKLPKSVSSGSPVNAGSNEKGAK